MAETAKIGIEFVCTGNNGRSIVAEAAALDYIKAAVYPRFGDVISVSSSGIYADDNTNSIMIFERARFMLERGYKYHTQYTALYSSSEVQFIKAFLADKGAAQHYQDSENYKAIADGLSLRTRELFASREQEQVKRILRNNGLMLPSSIHKQFVRKENMDYILGMDQKHVDRAREVYDRNQKRPIITSLFQFAYDNPLSIEDSFGNPDPEMHDFFFSHIIRATQKSIEKIAIEKIVGREKAVLEAVKQ